MWWTQPRLAVATCSLHAVVYGVVVIGIGDARVQAVVLAGWVGLTLIAYRSVSRELARRHETGLMRDAFERANLAEAIQALRPFRFL